MINIIGITPGKNTPSSRFRVRQYIEGLKKYDVKVDEYYAPIPYDYKLPGSLGHIRQRYIFPLSAVLFSAKIFSRIPHIIKSYQYDAIWLNRPMMDGIKLEKYFKKLLFFDVDDAIWYNDEKHCISIAKQSNSILAGNSFIAEWFMQFNKNVYVIPTSIDTERFYPVKEKSNEYFKIVWSGSQQTEQYLLSIEEPVHKFLMRYSNARLVIVSDRIPLFKVINFQKIIYKKWDPLTEVSAIQDSHVGIMPLFDSDWERGKCSFKMLQYMSVGIPVIVSPVGMNNEVLNKGECGYAAANKIDWIGALEECFLNHTLRSRMGKTGRHIIENYYNMKDLTAKLAEIFINNRPIN